MDQIYSKDQSFETFQPFITNLAPQTNSEQAVGGSTVPNVNVTSVHHANHSSNDMMQPQQSEQTFQNTSINTTLNSPIVQNAIVDNQPIHPNIFFYQPPNDYYNYHIKYTKCEEFSIQLLNKFSDNISSINFNQNKYIFFYQSQINSPIFQIICEIVSPSFINNLLNRTHGIEIEQNINIRHEQLTFNPQQKINLKFYLSQYLNHCKLN